MFFVLIVLISAVHIPVQGSLYENPEGNLLQNTLRISLSTFKNNILESIEKFGELSKKGKCFEEAVTKISESCGGVYESARLRVRLT
jgi:hypothetical protein